MKKEEKIMKTEKKSGSSKSMMFLLLVVAAMVIIGLVAATITRQSSADAAAGTTFMVQRGDLTITVSEAGSIRARNSKQYKCNVESRGIETTIIEIVQSGKVVTREDVENGLVLVKLDSSQLEEQLSQEIIELTSDQERDTAARESKVIQELDNESSIARAELNVRFALLTLQKYIGTEIADKLVQDVNESSDLASLIAPFVEMVKNDPNIIDGSSAWQNMKRLNDDIVLAQGNLKTAEETYAGTVELHDVNYVSDLELERDRLNVISRVFSEENSKVSLDLFLEYDFPKNIEQYLSDYIEANRSLERTDAQCRSRYAQAAASVSMAQSRLKTQQERVNDLKKQIEYCTIKAEAPGTVIYGTGTDEDMFRAMRGGGGSRSSSSIIAEGEAVYQGQVLISMPDNSEWVAEISVHETEVDKVRPGQLATIIMEAFPDKILNGTILQIATFPDQTRGFMNPDLKVYKTLVLIEGDPQELSFLKSRMSCKVEILVDQLTDVILVPIQVVANRGGKKVVFVGDQAKEVRTGAFNDAFVQILDGLDEGELVQLNPPLYTEQSASEALQERLRQRMQENGGDVPGGGLEDGTQGRRGRGMGGRGGFGGEGMPEGFQMPEGMEFPAGGRGGGGGFGGGAGGRGGAGGFGGGAGGAGGFGGGADGGGFRGAGGTRGQGAAGTGGQAGAGTGENQ